MPIVTASTTQLSKPNDECFRQPVALRMGRRWLRQRRYGLWASERLRGCRNAMIRASLRVGPSSPSDDRQEPGRLAFGDGSCGASAGAGSDLSRTPQSCPEGGRAPRRGRRAAPPLLIIAGAGTGKTNTLAHRVAHLIAKGGDPGRVLLLTFSRRAAEEMTRRTNRILAQLTSKPRHCAGSMAGLPWSGIFHSVGARLLREYAPSIGLSPGFSLHDRADSADLMNLVRHELGMSTKDRRFPLKGTCLGV